MPFALGDYLFCMLLGVVTALAACAIVWSGMDMVVAMLIGMAIGVALHLVLPLLLAPLPGMFETMISGSLIGMFGAEVRAQQEPQAMRSIASPCELPRHASY